MVNNDHKLSKHRSKMNPGGLRGLLRPSSGLKALPRPDFMRFLSRFELILGTKKRLTITSFFENVCLCASPEGFLRAPGLHFERFWLMFGDCWVIFFRPSDLVIFQPLLSDSSIFEDPRGSLFRCVRLPLGDLMLGRFFNDFDILLGYVFVVMFRYFFEYFFETLS